jgi:hypothetical protein
LALLLGAVVGCAAATPSYLGRPCSETEPCGAGTRCDLVKKVCVSLADGTASDGPGPIADRAWDAPAGSDKPASETGVADRGVADRGVTDRNVTDRGVADRGVDRGCVPACAAGLDCVAGSCTCVAGGSCAGCCNGGSCVALSAQATGLCGKNGAACGGCADTNDCTDDGCASGSCTHTPKANGTSCSGGVCNSGTCVVCPQSCADLGYYTGSLRSCTFDGSNGCTCPGTDSNNNNVCDSGESCWGWDNCSTGDHNPANCHTKKSISVPMGCAVPAPGYCIECS